MSKWDKEYIKLCKDILATDFWIENRTGIRTKKIPFRSFEFDLSEEFPILTTKFVAFKSSVLEVLWFYQAQSNDVRWLQERNVKIWNEWQIDKDGNYLGRKFDKKYAYTIGTAYGYVVNKYKLVDKLIDNLKNNPENRRMIMSLWDESLLQTAVLPSCVWNTMWDVTDGKLNCVVTCRSNDVALGMPFNVSQYAVLTHLFASVCGLNAGKLYYNAKDLHIYENQVEGIQKQINRFDENGDLPVPKLWVNDEIKDFYKFDNSKELKDIKLIDYKHMGKIEMEVAV